MHNPRISKKERGLIKGALRRVFSRSELRRQALNTCKIDHVDEHRPRVGKWGFCSYCGEVIPLYLLEVDHRAPVVGLHESLDTMSWDLLVDRLWCTPDNLIPTCKSCHKSKTKVEMKERRRLKNEQKRKVS